MYRTRRLRVGKYWYYCSDNGSGVYEGGDVNWQPLANIVSAPFGPVTLAGHKYFGFVEAHDNQGSCLVGLRRSASNTDASVNRTLSRWPPARHGRFLRKMPGIVVESEPLARLPLAETEGAETAPPVPVLQCTTPAVQCYLCHCAALRCQLQTLTIIGSAAARRQVDLAAMVAVVSRLAPPRLQVAEPFQVSARCCQALESVQRLGLAQLPVINPPREDATSDGELALDFRRLPRSSCA